MRRARSIALLTSLGLHVLACAGGTEMPARGESSSGGVSGVDDGDSTTALPDSDGSTDDDGGGAPPADVPAGVCGDGVLDADEQCDDGIVDGAYGGCLPDCSGPAPSCGDGERFEARESCDAGPAGDATCNAQCRVRGEVIASLREDSGLGEVGSIRGTTWSSRPAAVFGGASTTVWEIDPAVGATARVRTTSSGFDNISGVVGFDDGALVISDGDDWRIRRFDGELASTWTFNANPELSASSPGFVGMAPVGDGFVVGGRLHSYAPLHSAFYAIAFDHDGALLWQQLQTLYGTADVVAHDLQGIGEGRSVLLTRRVGGWPGARIFDAEGTVVVDVEVPELDDVYFDLCAGPSAFYLASFADGELVGYAPDGTPTTSVTYAPPEDPFTSASACAVDGEGLPVVARLERQDDGDVAAVLFRDGDQPLAEVPMGHNVELATDAVAVVLDDARAQLWIFAAGFAHVGQDTRTVVAVAVAL